MTERRPPGRGEAPALGSGRRPREGETAITDVGTPSEHASEVVAKREVATFGDPDPPPSRDGVKRVLAFLNEVAGGRKLLTAVPGALGRGRRLLRRGRPAEPADRRPAGRRRGAPRRRSEPGRRDPGRCCAEFGIESEGAVMDPNPPLALDDAVRATQPDYILLSCLYETRFGLTRKDLVEWAKARYGQSRAHPGASRRRRGPLGRHPHAGGRDPDRATARTSSTGSRSGPGRGRTATRSSARAPATISREEISSRLAATLAEMYRNEIDATGQPMSPDPYPRDPERDRALPDRRHPDLDPEGRAVEVARGGPDREGPGASPTSRWSTSSPGPSPPRRAHGGRDTAADRRRRCGEAS